MNEQILSEEEQRIAQAHIDLMAKRDQFVELLVPALMNLGFNVTGLPLPTGPWQGGQIIATKPEVHRNFKMLFVFDIKSSGWHRKTPRKLSLKFGQDMGYRGRVTRYTKLDAKLVTVLARQTETQLANAIDYDQQRLRADQDKADFAHRRVMELAGHLNPPGTEINIISGYGPLSGKYTVSFNHGSITDLSLTRDQVVRLMDVLNEIQGSTNALMLVSKHKIDGSELIWVASGFWSNTNMNPALFATTGEAENQMLRARAKSDNPDTVEIVRYDSRNVIKPGNPVLNHR